jgi:RimJ/RimL family protein N-acetyltransferase
VSGFEIREAVPGDAPALVELAREVGSEPEAWLISTRDWRGAGEERRYLRSLRRSQDAAVFVAEVRGAIVGRLSVGRDPHPASSHVADLGLMVAKGHRRRGVGRSLLQRAVEWAYGAGVSKLELHVFPHNDPALRLYETFGFRQEGYRRGHYRRGDELVDAILMAYDVTPRLERR